MSGRRQEPAGLVGGSIEARVRHSKVPPVDLPHVLAPHRRPADEAPFAAFLEADRPLHVEIGFGRAHHLCGLAAARPDEAVLGFETRREWVRNAAGQAQRKGLDNLRVVEGDARPYLEDLLPDGRLATLHVLFPDPWWKRRHHKRRIFQASFLDTAWRLLAPGGSVFAKTDVPAYADAIEALFDRHPGFSLAATSLDDPLLQSLPPSHREKKCRELGISAFPFRYVKESAS